jgi:hypothetical protein
MPDETTKFESSQALFCAFVDLVGDGAAKKIFFEKGNFPNGKMVYETYQKFVGYDDKGKKLSPSKVKDKQLIQNRKNIEIAFGETDTPAMNLDAMEDFLGSNKPWFYSSVVIAVKLISDLHSKTAGGISLAAYKGLGRKGMGNIDYVRGDKDVMGNIEKIFKVCMNNQKAKATVLKGMQGVPFKDANKWSPADIYYASDKAKTRIQKFLTEAEDDSYEPTYYHHLNTMIHELMVSGDLLGVSLKKQPDPKNVKISLVNFSQGIKDTILTDIHYKSHNVPTGRKSFKNITPDPKGGKREVKAPPKSKKKVIIRWPGGAVPTKKESNDMPGRDFVITLEGGSNAGNIQMRHDPSNNGWKVDFKGKGSGARAGSVTSYGIFCDIWALVDKSTANTFRSAMGDARTAFTTKVKQFMNDTKKVQRLQQIPFKTVTDAGKWITKGGKTWFRFKSSAYDFQKGEISAITFMNAILPILTAWFNRTDKKAKSQQDAFCQLIFQYVTSRHPESGKFIIVK